MRLFGREKADYLRTQKVLPKLPSYMGGDFEKLPVGLAGARIVSIGTVMPCDLVEGGGLVIDFIPRRCKQVRRVVLAFNDCGMWVEPIE